MKKYLIFVMVSVFALSSYAQKNIKFSVDPSEVKPLQEEYSNIKTTSLERWDDIRISNSNRSNCFPNFDRPLLPTESDVWDRDIVSITKTLPSNSQLLWVDSKGFIIQEGGNDLIFISDTITQIYAGLRRMNSAGQIDCQELFPARRFYLAGYSDGSWGIDFNAVTGKVSIDIDPFIAKEFELIINNLMMADSVFGSESNKVWLENGLDGLQNGTYRVQLAFNGHASQTHYLVKCANKFEAQVNSEVANSCPSKGNGKIEFNNITGGSGHYNVVLFNEVGESIERGLFDRDNMGLRFEGLEPGNYTFQVQDIFKVAYDEFAFSVVEDSLVCECQNTTTTAAIEVNFDNSFNQQLLSLQQKIDSLLSLTSFVGEVKITASKIVLFPSPTVEFLQFKLSDSAKDQLSQIEILDMEGKLIQKISDDEKEILQLNVSHLQAGQHICSLLFGNIRVNIKFIKM